MAAGCATVRMIEEENLLQNCQRMSDRFRERLESLKEELPIIGELRIKGMMVGIDLTIPAGPAVEKCDAARRLAQRDPRDGRPAVAAPQCDAGTSRRRLRCPGRGIAGDGR